MLFETRRVIIKSDNTLALYIAVKIAGRILLIDCESKPLRSSNDPESWVDTPDIKIAHQYLFKSLWMKSPLGDKTLWEYLPEDILLDADYISSVSGVVGEPFRAKGDI